MTHEFKGIRVKRRPNQMYKMEQRRTYKRNMEDTGNDDFFLQWVREKCSGVETYSTSKWI